MVIKHKNLFLCCQRGLNKLDYLSEKWEFPGGKIEEGETHKQALVREIKEELEMEIFNIVFSTTVTHQYNDFELTMHVYKAFSSQAKFKLNVHKKAVWSPLKKLKNFNWAAADIPIIKHLQKQL